MRRVVEPELLDELPPSDPQAVRSRGDLRRLNFLMGHAGFLTECLSTLFLSPAFLTPSPREARAGRGPGRGAIEPSGALPKASSPQPSPPAEGGEGVRNHEQFLDAPFHTRPLRMVELGAGDGTLLLRLARRWAARGVKAEATLLDRQNLVSAETRRAFAALHWSVECVASDVFTWLEQSSPVADVMLANLFLHHFSDEQLATLFRLAAARTNLFLACEPRRAPLALAAARSLGLIGCHAVTRHDAVVSVRAGFAGHELTALWPAATEWTLRENSTGLFSHGFIARRNV